MTRLEVRSREYKVMLQPERFGGDEREVRDSGKRQVTLKYRHPDRYVSSDRDMKAGGDVEAETKFEEDVKPPFISVFSYSTSVEVDDDADFSRVGHVAELFPGLDLHNVDEDAELANVGGFCARELVLVGASVQLGKRDVDAECAMVMWHDDDDVATPPVCVEFSFKYGDDEEDYRGSVTRDAHDVLHALHGELADWIHPEPKTKTAFVYGWNRAMPTSLGLDEHLAALQTAGDRLVATAEEAGMDVPVPTCPAWTAAALVAHQAMVHRWATAHVRGDDLAGVPNQTDVQRTVADLSGYFREGLAALVAAVRAAPPDLDAMTFLNDAPRPREFWARRQAHETTIHMVDAVGAQLGRPPTADEAGIEQSLAVDGIDELVRGFFTRGRSKLYDGTEYTVAVTPRDAERRWVLRVAERLTVDAGDGSGGETDATLSGTAAELYLALWNRGDHVAVVGRQDLLDRWRATQRVKWS